MTDDPFELAALLATLAARASVEAVRLEYKGHRNECEHLMRRVREGIAAIKAGSVDRMQRQVELLRSAGVSA